jgi:restriction system protein
MAVPDYQSLMLPMLEYLKDKKEHAIKEINEFLAGLFKLTEEERNILLTSGQQPVFDNRVGWAKTYLKKAGLLVSPARATALITDRGMEVLSKKPDKINVKFLRQFQEFLDFQNLKNDKLELETDEDELTQTPQEILESSYQQIRKSLAQDLTSRILKQPPQFFEKLVIELLVKMGYGGSLVDAGKALGKTGDEGIDGTIKEDKLGLDIVYIQAKRWESGNVVGRPEIQKFVGALAGQGAKKGIFITTSSFTKDALEYQPKNETKVVLIDGEYLAQLMIDYNIGVSLINTYEIKKIDNDYFGDE